MRHRPIGCATTGVESTLAGSPQKAKYPLASAKKILWKMNDGQPKSNNFNMIAGMAFRSAQKNKQIISGA
jgi:hypothetical protein